MSWTRFTDTTYQRVTPIIWAAGLKPMERREAYPAVAAVGQHSIRWFWSGARG